LFTTNANSIGYLHVNAICN